MNQRRAMLKALFLPVAAGVAGGAVTGVVTTAEAAWTWSTATVPISGTVSGAPESVAFAGNARVSTRLAQDPDFGKPSLIISIDMTEVAGVGSITRKSYTISGPSLVQKRHGESHSVDITFAFYPSGTSGVSNARSGLGTFVMTMNTVNGSVATVTAKISSLKL